MPENKPLTPKEVVRIMRQNGREISENEAAKMLKFMRKMAILTVNQMLEK